MATRGSACRQIIDERASDGRGDQVAARRRELRRKGLAPHVELKGVSGAMRLHEAHRAD